MSFSDHLLELPFPDFETIFPPWENQLESPTVLSSLPLPSPHHHPVNSTTSNFYNEPTGPNEEKEDEVDRKRKRMISNRESARRSRMRKHEHLEGLRNQLKRLRIDNAETKKTLGIVARNLHFLRMDNHKLRLESEILSRRLSDICGILIFRKLQELSPMFAV